MTTNSKLDKFTALTSAYNDLRELITSIDYTHSDAHLAIATVLISWFNNNDPTIKAYADAPEISALLFNFGYTCSGEHPEYKKAIAYLESATSNPDHIFHDSSLIHIKNAMPIVLENIHDALDRKVQDSLDSVYVKPRVADPVVSEPVVTPVVSEPVVTPVVSEPVVTPVVSEPVVTPVVSEPVVTPVVSEPVVTPVVSEPVVTPVSDALMEDLALANGIAIISGEDWKRSKFSRDIPVIIKNFDFRHLELPELGRAGHLLIAPNKEQDIRIELRSQSVSGSAGDKLPVTIRKFRRLQQSREYGQTFVGIVGSTELFSEDALGLAREEAVKSGRLIYAEGDETVAEALSLALNTVVLLHKPAIPSIQPGLDLS